MPDELSKLCSDLLRKSYPGLGASHARELTASFFGYKSHMAFLAAHRAKSVSIRTNPPEPEIELINHRLTRLRNLPESIRSGEQIAAQINEYLRANNGTHGDRYIRRDIEPNLLDHLIDGMEAALDAEYRDLVDNFLSQYQTSKWMIASDYSMGRPEFTHDAMVFVLIPYIAKVFPPTEIESCLPVDFKECGTKIDPSYISFLRDVPAFSFVFLLDRSQPIFSTAELAEKAVEESLSMMKAWPNAKEQQNAEIIRKSELCLSKAKTKSFLRKVNEITMLAMLGAFVGLVATKRIKKVDGILWAPDRDNMNGVWEGLSSALFQANFHSVLHRRKMSEKYTLGTVSNSNAEKELWFDPYVRLADFLATPAAAMTRSPTAQGNFAKCDQITKEVFTDNPRLIVQRLAFPTSKGTIIPDFKLMRFSKNPFPEKE